MYRSVSSGEMLCLVMLHFRVLIHFFNTDK